MKKHIWQILGTLLIIIGTYLLYKNNSFTGSISVIIGTIFTCIDSFLITNELKKVRKDIGNSNHDFVKDFDKIYNN